MFYFHQFYSAILMEYARNSKDRYALLPGYYTHFMVADVKEEYIEVNGSRIFHRYHYDEKSQLLLAKASELVAVLPSTREWRFIETQRLAG